MLVASQIREDVEREEGPTLKQTLAGLTAEIAISSGVESQVQQQGRPLGLLLL